MRVVRDIFSADFERAVVDDEGQYQRLVSFFTRTAPELLERVELYQGAKPLFEESGVDDVIDGLISRRVDLPSGGYLMIDYAEALTVFDVNSGSFVGRGKQARLEDTITRTNLEAAEEVVRQLRLRDIGGIIVIDFIDMAKARNRDAVLKTLRGSLEQDRTKTFTAEISKLGLVEMTRQNVTEGVREIISRTCPACDGDARRAQRGDDRDRVRPQAARARGARAAQRRGVPRQGAPRRQHRVHRRRRADAARARGGDRQGLPLRGLGQPAATTTSTIVMEGTVEEVRERAVPFQEGEEVLVTIVEPHMYNVDDAVAKIDGYVVSVTGGGRHVGEKRLVRIEEAGRNSARATLVGAEPEGRDGAAPADAAEGAAATGDGLQSKPRRRGRRGGRRRSAARADAASAADKTSE